MKVLRLTRTDESFYSLLGPVFGSRIVEQSTHDRFYDDPNKIWYLVPDRGAASVLDTTIRNFWAVDEKTAVLIIDALLAEYDRLKGILPNRYESVFHDKGFRTQGYRKNFIEVRYEKHSISGVGRSYGAR